MISIFYTLWIGATDPFGPNGQIGHIQRLKILSPIVNKRLLYQQRVVTPKEGWHSAWTGSVVTDSQGISGIQNRELSPILLDSWMMEARQSMLVSQTTGS